MELTQLYLTRIERLSQELNAFITVTVEEALAAARVAERELMRGKRRGPLHGIPIALKDNIWTKGIRTTAGSKILARVRARRRCNAGAAAAKSRRRDYRQNEPT